jgi:hyperosmotically inducible protein
MKHKEKLIYAALAALLLTATTAMAERVDRKTELTVNERIEIPGHILTPGTYYVELVNNTSADRVVTFRDSEQQLVTLAFAISAQRADVEGTSFTFYETPANEPPAMRKWFHPGSTIGVEFVYPETRGNKLAGYSHRHVPTMSDQDYEKAFKGAQESDQIALKEVTVYAVSPENEKVALEQAAKANAASDRLMYDSSKFLRSRALEETQLERQIRKEIVTLPFYSLWDHIAFSVNDSGEVTLDGKVYRPSLKGSVERAVSSIEGVDAVDNQLEVLPTSFSDDDIRMAIYRSIYGHSALQQYQLRAVPPIHIIVENGRVTLEGVVGNTLDKRVAGMQANSVNGVFEVVNKIRVEG